MCRSRSPFHSGRKSIPRARCGRACLPRPGSHGTCPDRVTLSMTNRTKIVATIGPASWKTDVLRQLIAAGVSVFRLNFSHGTHEEHSAVLADIRALGRDMERHVAVLQDLCGPKMRLGPIPGDVVECPLD